MYKFLITIFLFIFLSQNSHGETLDRDAIKERLKQGYICAGIFGEAQFSDLLTTEIITTHFYGMYHSKASDIIIKPMFIVFKKLKKNKMKLSKEEHKELESYLADGGKITKNYLSEDRFNLGKNNMVPVFVKGGNNKTGLIPKKDTEPKEMIACKQKYGMDEDDLLTTGVMSTKVSKKKIKAIAEKYLFGF